MGADEIRTFLLHLAQERKVAAATFNVYAGALKFLYAVTLGRPKEIVAVRRMRVPMHVPVVLSPIEVERLLGALASDKHRVLVMLAYGAGLRVSEVCKLRVDDIDPKRMAAPSPSTAPSCSRASCSTCCLRTSSRSATLVCTPPRTPRLASSAPEKSSRPSFHGRLTRPITTGVRCSCA